MNKQETALVREAMKAMQAEITGSYGLGNPSARKANRKVVDVLSLTGTTWSLINWEEGKTVFPVMGWGSEGQARSTYGLHEGWQRGLWALCWDATKGKGIVVGQIDSAVRPRVTTLATLYNACLVALAGESGLQAEDWARINGYLKAEWPVFRV